LDIAACRLQTTLRGLWQSPSTRKRKRSGKPCVGFVPCVVVSLVYILEVQLCPPPKASWTDKFSGVPRFPNSWYKLVSCSTSSLQVYSLFSSCFFFLFLNERGGTFGTAATYWPIVPAPDDRWWWLWRNWWNEDWQGGKPKYSEKTCPSATSSITFKIDFLLL
jgi:hypothetical protein